MRVFLGCFRPCSVAQPQVRSRSPRQSAPCSCARVPSRSARTTRHPPATRASCTEVRTFRSSRTILLALHAHLHPCRTCHQGNEQASQLKRRPLQVPATLCTCPLNPGICPLNPRTCGHRQAATAGAGPRLRSRQPGGAGCQDRALCWRRPPSRCCYSTTARCACLGSLPSDVAAALRPARCWLSPQAYM